MRWDYIFPDTIQAASGNPPAATGATDANKINDASDATLLTFTAANQWIRAGFADLTLAANERIWAIVGYARVYASSAGNVLDSGIAASNTVDTTTGLDGVISQFLNAPISDQYGPIQTKDFSGAEWTDAHVDGIYFYLKKTVHASTLSLTRLSIGVAIVTQPVATIIVPASSALSISRGPLVQWSYSGFGEAQYKYRVKIFTAAVAEGGGFDPASSTAVYDSGTVTSSSQQHQVPANTLTNGAVYYVSIKVTKSMNLYGSTGMADYDSNWSTASKFTVNALPTATVTAPPDPTNNTNRPTVTFTYNDTDLDHGTAYEIKMFDTATYSGGGFSADTSTPDWTSGVIDGLDLNPGDAVSVRTGALTNDTYRAYVRVQQTTDGSWSAWSYKQFVLSVTGPLAPIFTATADATNARVTLSIQRNASGIQPEFYTVQRSDDGGVTWANVRGTSDLNAYSGSSTITLYDYEMPFNRSIQYRAFMWDQTVDDTISGAITTVTLTFTMGFCWLKDPLTPADNMKFPVQDMALGRSRPKDRAVHHPIGRLKPLVVRGALKAESFVITYTIIGQTKYDALLKLLNKDLTLLVQTSQTNWYIEVMDVTIQEYLWDKLHGEQDPGSWIIGVSCQEVAAP